jgi:hypothetical protein
MTVFRNTFQKVIHICNTNHRPHKPYLSDYVLLIAYGCKV